MRLDSTGNLGIGTSNPSSKLDVNGTVTADGLTVEGSDTRDRHEVNIASGQPEHLMYVNDFYIGSLSTSDADNPNSMTLESDFGAGVLIKSSSSSTNSAKGNATKSLFVKANNDVEFFEDTGTTAKMVWDASAENLNITGQKDSTSLTLSASLVTVGGGTLADYNQIYFNNTSGVGDAYIRHWANAHNDGKSALTFGTSETGTVTERMRIDSSGNVGIGTASPSALLHMSGASAQLRIEATSGNSQINFADSADSNIGILAYDHSSNAMTFRTNDAERARLDSSGNLLVGTSTSPAGSGGLSVSNRFTVGYQGALNGYGAENYSGLFYSGGNNAGYTAINSNSANGCLYLSRTSSAPNGLMLHFASNGSSVGQINTTGGDLTIGTGDTGVRFDDGTDQIYPVSGTTTRDAAVSLGWSGGRFKDLYLSGGVYLGGTGSANKLEDYETGNWTSSVTPSGTGSITLYTTEDRLAYTKVGRVVTVTGRLIVQSVSSPTGGSISIGGLPFNIANLAESAGFIGGTISYRDHTDGSWSNLPMYGLEADNKIYSVVDVSTIAADDRMHFSFSYFTTA